MEELTDDVLHSCTLETYIIVLTSATLIHAIKTVVPEHWDTLVGLTYLRVVVTSQ